MRLIELLSEAKATKTRLDPKCWKGKKIGNPKTKVKGGVRVNNCVPKESVKEGDVFFIEAGDTLIETTIVYESQGRILIDLDDAALKIIESGRQISEVGAMKAFGAAGRRAAQAVGKLAKAPIGAGLSFGAAVAAGLQPSREQGAEWLKRSDMARDKTIDLVKTAGKRAKKAATNLGHAVTKSLGEDTSNLEEAKYHGKEVPLGKRLPGDVKKSKVYVRKPNGKIVKVNFGDKKMRIKKSNPKRRKSFRARHNCKNPGPRWKARYWSCRAW